MNVKEKLELIQRRLGSIYGESNNNEVCDLCKTLSDLIEVLEEMDKKFNRVAEAFTDDGK